MPKRKKPSRGAFENAINFSAAVTKRALSPFGRRLGWTGLAKRWLAFIFAAAAVMAVIQYYANYDLSAADKLTSDTGVGCDTLAMATALLMPPIEELLFRIGPHKLWGKRAAFVGSVAWAMLHLAGRNFAVAGFQLVMSMFYFKLVTGGRYKEVVIFHEAFNLVPLLTCFLF